MAAKPAPSICAAQPVTTTGAWGRSRSARRTACLDWRAAPTVTAQVLTIVAFDRPLAWASRAMSSVSTALSRQPKLTA